MQPIFQAIAQLVQDKIVPGASAAVLAGGTVTTMVTGASQWQPKVKPLHSGMRYDLASLTKVIGTTTVFLQALTDGKVALDQPLHDFLPAFSAPTTFRQALTHTSGLEGYIPHRDELPPDQLKRALLTQLQVTDEVDSQVVYRDVNLLLVGWALEAIYQQPIQPLITMRVLHPLGLRGATFTPAPATCVPTSYDAATGALKQGVVHDPKSAILGEHSGAAGLFATLQDLIRFTEFMFGMHQAAGWPSAYYGQPPRDFTANYLGRSLGWDLRQDPGGRQWFYHTGYTGTFWLIQPQSRQALIVLTNRVHPVVNQAFLARRDVIVADFLTAAT